MAPSFPVCRCNTSLGTSCFTTHSGYTRVGWDACGAKIGARACVGRGNPGAGNFEILVCGGRLEQKRVMCVPAASSWPSPGPFCPWLSFQEPSCSWWLLLLCLLILWNRVYTAREREMTPLPKFVFPNVSKSRIGYQCWIFYNVMSSKPQCMPKVWYLMKNISQVFLKMM